MTHFFIDLWEHFFSNPDLFYNIKKLPWLCVISDFIIFTVYFSIFIIIIYSLIRKKEFFFSIPFFIVVLFIFFHGINFVLDEAILLQYPMYKFSSFVKITTALISIGAAFSFIRLIPQALSLTELERTHRYLAQIVGSSHEGIISTDMSNTITSWNKSAERLYGYSREEAIGKHISLIIPSYSQNRQPEELSKESQTTPNVLKRKTQHVGKLGNPIFVSSVTSPILDHEGQLIGMSEMVEDLTEQKNLEDLLQQKISELKTTNQILKEKSNSLKEAQHFYDEFYENAADMFLSIEYQKHPDMLSNKRQASRIIRCNRTLSEKLGFSKEEILNMLPEDLYHPKYAPQVKKEREKLLTEGILTDCEFQIVTKTGKTIHIFANATVVRNEHGHIISSNVLWRDMTALFEARQNATNKEIALNKVNTSLQEAVSTLDRVNKDLESFVYIASHDLRSPLRTIHCLAQLIEEDPINVLSVHSRTMFDTLKQKARRMDKFIRDLLIYYQAESNNSISDKVNTFILVQEVLDMLDVPKSLIFNCDTNMPIINTFKIPLHQVFHNLISNAIKYNNKPGAKEVSISCKELPNYWEFSVKDNGPGIPEESYEKIFNLFEKLESRDTIDGSGLGLAIVKKLVEKYGESVIVSSTLGKGSTFSFRWSKAQIRSSCLT